MHTVLLKCDFVTKNLSLPPVYDYNSNLQIVSFTFDDRSLYSTTLHNLLLAAITDQSSSLVSCELGSKSPSVIHMH